jgi:dephospho-CoA kinase
MVKSKIVLGLIGEKGAGKGTVSKYLIDKYGAAHFGTSIILKRTIDDLHLPVTRENLIKLALVLKEGFWPSVVIDALITDIEGSDSQLVIADGIRMFGDVEPFKKKYGENFHLIYVTAPLKIRYERTKSRGEKAEEKNLSFEQFLIEEGRLTEVSIHEIGAKAEFTLDNSQGPENLIVQAERLMGIIMNKNGH